MHCKKRLILIFKHYQYLLVLLVKISKTILKLGYISKIYISYKKKMQSYIRYLILFPREITKLTKPKLSAFCLKQVQLSASGVSEIFVKQEYFT